MKQDTERSYSVGATGIIFTNDVVVISDDNDKELARGETHRTAYEPDTDMNAEKDETLKALSDVVWTPEVIAAYKANKND